MKITLNLTAEQAAFVRDLQETKMHETAQETVQYIFDVGIGRTKALHDYARKTAKVRRALDAGKPVDANTFRPYAPLLPVFNAERAAVKRKAGKTHKGEK
jgi:hypothetical protein